MQKTTDKTNELKKKYNLEHIEEADSPKVMKILRKVDGGVRLSKDELIWILQDEHEKYYTRELKEGYLRNEARFYAGQYNKTKNYNELKKKYNLEHIEEADSPKVMKILRKVDGGVRLSKDELIWLLQDEHKKYYTRELEKGHHRNEARFYAGQYNKTKNYWAVVNASSHYRKCGESATADSMLKTIDISGLKNKKLKSALFTTHGGVKRDLRQWNEALNLGEQAHLLTPQDFRPCTLLGAVNYDIGNYDLGDYWFKKAIERGYDKNSMDNELRSIFRRADESTKKALRDHLLTKDPIRYSWAKKKVGHRRSQKSKKSNKK